MPSNGKDRTFEHNFLKSCRYLYLNKVQGIILQKIKYSQVVTFKLYTENEKIYVNVIALYNCESIEAKTCNFRSNSEMCKHFIVTVKCIIRIR